MTAFLFLPQQQPRVVNVEGLPLPDAETGLVSVPEQVPILLGCPPGLVDILASGHDYITYSIFDCEGDINLAAMDAVAKVSGVSFDANEEDEVLRGPVLMMTRNQYQTVLATAK